MGEPEVALDLNQKLANVNLTALATVSLIQHSNESSEATYGHLLGLYLGDTVEVSNSYPISTRVGPSFYEDTVAPLYGNNGFDKDLVGWYQRSDKGDCFDMQSAEYQFAFQKTNSGFVMVVYTPNAQPSLRAYQLSETFMKIFADSNHTQSALNQYDLKSSDVFVEFEIAQTYTPLEQAFMLQYAPSPAPKLLTGYVENQMAALNECLDERMEHDRNLVDQLQAVAEDKAAESRTMHPPSRLENLLLGSQIKNFCDDLSAHATNFDTIMRSN